MGFVHLHVHSEYSLLDGAARIDDLAEGAASMDMPAMALTDHGVMYGAIAFYRACRKRGVKPVIGCEMYLTTRSLADKGPRRDNPVYHLILLAKNLEGYRNLMRLTTIAHFQGFHYKPRIDLEQLNKHSAGLICLSSCLAGEVSRLLLQDREDEAAHAAMRYKNIFGDDFYLEIQDHGLLEQKRVMQKMIELSRSTGIPLVATNDVHYMTQADASVQDVLLCIGTGKTVEDTDRMKFPSDQLYLKSSNEMDRLFAHVPEALDNTLAIAAKCNLELEFDRALLPAFHPVPEGKSASEYLSSLCLKGLEERYRETAKWQDQTFRATVSKRLAYELQVIERMGYADYFLIVWDFIRYAHEQGIAVGPGRGSSAGSLVAYVLRITDVDPIKYRLLFERFLNPERVSMPDIDIDFSDERRDEVIHYVARKYGAEHVAQIITFGTMAAKAAIRDVGRALNMSYGEVDRTAKLIPGQSGITIEKAVKASQPLAEACGKSSSVSNLIDMAKRVEGLPRHASTHAAGIVISREPLTQYVPLQQGTELAPLTQYAMEHLEEIGLLKMDFLGLRTLSIIERTVQGVADQNGSRIDLRNIRDDDPQTYELLGRGETTGIFQLESPGMRRVLKELKPTNFEDIISVLALYRPGPMEFIPKYIQAKHKQIPVEYPHPSLEPILGDTYGIIVYQEQIMQIASAMAGFSLGEADLLRRAVSKKKRSVLDEQRHHFVQGCLQQGYEESDGQKVYDMIVRFADYGFPRAHAAAYGVLAYQTAYLKAHYPAVFMASMLTAVMSSHRKVAEYIDECRKMNITILPPDVNESGILFTTTRERAIRFGLAAVKNVGTQAIDSIINERNHAPYEDLVDFCRRVDLRLCNKRVIECLILSGAMDSLPGHRSQLIAMLDHVLEAAAKWKKEREDLQIHLFGFVEEVQWTIEYPDAKPLTEMEVLEYEKELLGLYLSGHPLDAYDALLSELAPDPLHYLPEYADQSEVVVVCMIVSVRQIVTRKGRQMAFLELEDRIARLEAVCFPEVWKQCVHLTGKGALIAVKGRLQRQDEDVKLIASEVVALDDPLIVDKLKRKPEVEQAGKLYIKICAEQQGADRLNDLKRIIAGQPGSVGVVLFYEKTRRLLALSDRYNVRPSAELFKAIETIMGPDTAKLK